jgi:prepilin-type N-terminal cleavage/methylation domain-containing protein/prepilin-type processing-associated H-X9-DG protein
MKNRTRTGFTVFELLVVLAILGFLLGILLPLIAQLRGSAARIESQNNLKQLAIAAHSYHDANQRFPSGNDQNNFSATAYLLPYIEQANLYQQLNMKVASTDKANAQVRGIFLRTTTSPLDPLARNFKGGAPTNYLFNAGSKYALENNDGVFFQSSMIRITDILDGTSNTVMIGETLIGAGGAKNQTVARQYVLLNKAALAKLDDKSGVADFQNGKHLATDRGSSWLDGRFLQGTFTGTRVINDARPDVSCEGYGGLSGLRSTSDYTNIAMCDGSVRTINRQVSLQVWNLLTSRNDGQPLPPNF